ncbi:MAG TPA: HEAT repeat domain-containing protein [Candidatus Acidoferrum sp.]|nr:HEAT repeat domain-containing protein [Candidatus Acidoferrum sp.]
MNTNGALSKTRRILGLAMIAVGIFCTLSQFSNGRGLQASFGPGLTYAATIQAGTDMPRVESAQAETRAVAGSLEATFRGILAQAEKPEWVGYSVDETAGERGMCCGNWNDGAGCGTCRLENDQNYWTSGTKKGDSQASGSIKLEGSRRLVVLFRLEAKQVDRIRVASEDCTLDAGGLPFLWLTGVKPSESVALLTNYVQGAEFERHEHHNIGQGALTAIALHADPSADRAMESFVQPDQREELRRQAAFWLGAARGKEGLNTLLQMAKNDPSSEVRAHVAFALSVSHEPGALEEMIRMAHDDSSSHVRGQALFWLAQKAGKKAVGTITGAIENDPDTEVKKKAVFALSQLPKDEGVPKLIEVAQTNRNREVRKQAMFWLGQSNDPRALQFFEQVLLK